MVRAVIVFLLVACGGDDGGQPAFDSGDPPGSPVIAISGPRANESFYPTQTVQIAWIVTDDETPIVSCDVDAIGATTIPIAADSTTPIGEGASAVWGLSGIAPGPYRIRVACTDANNLTGTALSGAFLVSAPAQQVSYASQVQPIWTACTGTACHDANQPAQGLDLTPSSSHAVLVGNVSQQCGAFKLVDPGAPERSYLVIKLQGSGPCFAGTRMPKTGLMLPNDKIQLVRDWIFNGAQDN